MDQRKWIYVFWEHVPSYARVSRYGELDACASSLQVFEPLKKLVVSH